MVSSPVVNWLEVSTEPTVLVDLPFSAVSSTDVSLVNPPPSTPSRRPYRAEVAQPPSVSAKSPSTSTHRSLERSLSNGTQKFEVPKDEFSLEEIAKHNTKGDLWVAVKGIVMDLTNWVDEHPGGPQALFSHMGRDASEEFEMLHDDEVIPKYLPVELVKGRVKGQEITLEGIPE
jgi:cytochrome b involved in lipid metabolism